MSIPELMSNLHGPLRGNADPQRAISVFLIVLLLAGFWAHFLSRMD